jgi:hypothetical protein
MGLGIFILQFSVLAFEVLENKESYCTKKFCTAVW